MYIVNFFLFISAVIFCFIFPGLTFIELAGKKFDFWEKIILGTVIGLIFFSLLSYLLSIINLHALLLPAIVFMDLFSVKRIVKSRHQISLTSKKRLLILTIVFTFGVIGQMLIIAPSGINLNGDLIFWSSHGHDGLWHLSLMQEYQKGYPLQNPVFAGEKLVNYHFFSDIAPADFNRYFKLPSLDLYFRFFPLLYSILLGSLAYILGKKMGGSFSAGFWTVVFTFFAGSFGYIATYLQNKSIGGESIFWASQPQSSIGNPPQIAAFIIVLAFLYLFTTLIEEKSKMLFSICVIFAGSLAVFKIYAAIVVLISLGLVGVWQLIKSGKIHILALSIISASLSTLLYFPNASNTGSFLIFEPWWFIRTMIVAPNKLNWIDLELKRQTYMAEGNFKRVIQIEVTGFLIFFFGNLGMRFLGLFYFAKILKNLFNNYLHMLIATICLVSLISPLLFLQKGVATNTIQFLQYFLLIFGILAALTVDDIFNRIKPVFLKLLLALLIVLLSAPTQLALIQSFYNRQPFTKISSGELSALQFLRESGEKSSVILTPPYNKYLELNDPIPNIWDWSDTAYISALTNKRIYLGDTEQVDIMGYDLKKRLITQEEIFKQEDPKIFSQEIKNLKVDYLYFPIILKPKVNLSQTPLSKVFSNSVVEIWKI